MSFRELKIAVGVWVISLLRVLLLPIVWLCRGAEYRMQTYLAEDCALNAFLAGRYDEPVSARAARNQWGKRQRIINWMFSDTNHCSDAYLNEIKRKKDYK